jgi:ABC-type nitrate/sulfonate/bicarbonate transport system permease component
MDKRKTPNLISRGKDLVCASPVLLLFLWEFLSRFNLINAVYFPSPSDIFMRFIQLLFHNQQFLIDIKSSVTRLIIGTVIAVPMAIIVGVGVGLNRKIGRFISPLIAITYPIPKLCILPLLMIILGIGEASKIAIIAIGIFYLVLLSVIQGIKGLPSIYFDIIFVYRITFAKKIFSVVLKGILPDILYGCKTGIGYGLVMVVAGEFIAAKNGVGFFMWNAWDQFRIKDLYAGLTFFSLAGWGIFTLFDWLLSKIKWRNNNATRTINS